MPEVKKDKSGWDSFKAAMTEAFKFKTPGTMQAEADKDKKAPKRVKDLGFLPNAPKKKN